MGIKMQGHKIHINLTIPLPYKYRGGGAAVFRINNRCSEVLLGLRANNPGSGLWTFPGGGAADGENLSTAAVREFREETGVQLYGRYITRTGLFQIRNPFFEWDTLIIESTQNIDIGKKTLKVEKNKDGTYRGYYPGQGQGHGYEGEFFLMRWVPVSDTGSLKLHRWVKNVLDFYMSGKMILYEAEPPEASPSPVKVNRSKMVQRVSGESLLFDMAEMVLTKVSRDGTKYFKPKNQICGKKGSAVQEVLYWV
jgi:ADP-ribose pyrophosphatase YjhB (NUDIX family)